MRGDSDEMHIKCRIGMSSVNVSSLDLYKISHWKQCIVGSCHSSLWDDWPWKHRCQQHLIWFYYTITWWSQRVENLIMTAIFRLEAMAPDLAAVHFCDVGKTLSIFFFFFKKVRQNKKQRQTEHVCICMFISVPSVISSIILSFLPSIGASGLSCYKPFWIRWQEGSILHTLSCPPNSKRLVRWYLPCSTKSMHKILRACAFKLWLVVNHAMGFWKAQALKVCIQIPEYKTCSNPLASSGLIIGILGSH